MTARHKREAAAEHCEPTTMVADLAELLRALKALVDPYHPELHYMRGPGPKWRAKNGSPNGSAVAVLVPVKARGA